MLAGRMNALSLIWREGMKRSVVAFDVSKSFPNIGLWRRFESRWAGRPGVGISPCFGARPGETAL
jgi:hypothetical protein